MSPPTYLWADMQRKESERMANESISFFMIYVVIKLKEAGVEGDSLVAGGGTEPIDTCACRFESGFFIGVNSVAIGLGYCGSKLMES